MYGQTGKYDEGVADHTAALSLNPKDAEGYACRGYTLQLQGKLAQAVADYGDAIRFAPEKADYRPRLDSCVKKLRESGKSPVVLSVKLDQEMKAKVIKKSPPIRNATEDEFKNTHTVKYAVHFTEGWKAEVEIRGTFSAWVAEVQVGVKTGIEKSTSKTYGAEKSEERSVKVGDKLVRVVWVEFCRTGVAKVKFDGVTVDIPFEFPDDWGLLTEEAK